MTGGAIISGIKSAIKSLGRILSRGAKKAITFVVSSKLGKKIATKSREFASNMLTKFQSRKWWARAVRVLKTSMGILGAVGKIGAALKAKGGILGLFGRGLSIFNSDYRSPKQFRSDMKAKEKAIDTLKKNRDRLIEKEKQAQAELKAPVLTEGLATSEEKLDEIARHLTLMKRSIGDIKATSFSSSTNIKGFEEYQIRANKRLADALDYGTQTNMKTTLTSSEDMRDSMKAISADSTASIVGEIGGKIDAIEEERREEEEFRRKNDWKRKLLKTVLFVADWVLNFWWNLGILALKIATVAGLFLLVKLSPYINKIYSMIWAFKNGFAGVVSLIIAAKIIQGMYWLLGKIVSLLKWVLIKLLNALDLIPKTILGFLSKIPALGKVFEKIREVNDTISDGRDKAVSYALDQLVGMYNFAKDSAKELANGYLEKIEKLYNATKKEEPNSIGVSGKEFVESSSEDLGDKIKSRNSDDLEDKKVEGSNSKEKDSDSKGLLGKVKNAAQDTASKVLGKTESFLEDNKVVSKIEDAKESAYSKGKDVLNKTSVFIEKSDLKEKSEEGAKIINDKLEILDSKLHSLDKSLQETLHGVENNNKQSPPTLIKGTEKISFKESAEQYKNLTQRS